MCAAVRRHRERRSCPQGPASPAGLPSEAVRGEPPPAAFPPAAAGGSASALAVHSGGGQDAAATMQPASEKAVAAKDTLASQQTLGLLTKPQICQLLRDQRPQANGQVSKGKLLRHALAARVSRKAARAGDLRLRSRAPANRDVSWSEARRPLWQSSPVFPRRDGVQAVVAQAIRGDGPLHLQPFSCDACGAAWTVRL